MKSGGNDRGGEAVLHTQQLQIAGEGKHTERGLPLKTQVPSVKGLANVRLTDEEKTQIQRIESARQRGKLLTGAGVSQVAEEEQGSQTERAIMPSKFATQKLSSDVKKRGSGSSVGALVSKVREQLESVAHNKSLSSWWLHVEHEQGEGGLTIGALQQGMVQAGVSPEDAGMLLQAILENRLGSAGSTIPGDRAPERADFLSALLSPGKLPQKSLDAAQRRLLQGNAWWSEGQISSNFRISQVQEGISNRDANTILAMRH